MIGLSESRKVKTVIVKDMSRMGRDYLKVGYYTESFFAERDIRYIAINDGVDSDKGDNDFTPFRNLFNDFYARDTSKKIRAVMRAKGNAGEHLCTNPPYGYMKSPDNKKEWIVDEEAAAVVKRIFELEQARKRIAELDRIFKQIYEDDINGPISHERFLKLSSEYEAEQKELTEFAKVGQAAVDTYEQDRTDFDSFAAVIRKYVGIRELTPAIVNEFVKKILVHAPDKSSGHRRQKIEIVWNFIGELEQDEDKQTIERQRKSRTA